MSNILNLAASGLLAFQRGMSTTGQNIANVATEGYSRQTVQFEARPSTRLGSFNVGTGVDLANIQRVNNELSRSQLRSSLADLHADKAYSNLASQLDSLLADADTSVANSLQNFFDAMHAVADNPDYLPARQSFLSQADLMVNRFNIMDDQLNALNSQINNEVKGKVTRINAIATNIAELNQEIVANGGDAPELLDKRDLLLNELSKYLTTTVISQEDGAINVSVGKGVSLVVGSTTSQLTTQPNPADPTQNEVALVASSSVIVSDSLAGGELGGVLQYRQEILQPVMNGVNRIALSLADEINHQHALGMDLHNQLGGVFFNDINSSIAQQNRVLANNNNQGDAQFTLAIEDVNQLTTSDYRLIVNASDYTVIRQSDKQVFTFTTLPQTLDGFRLDQVSGSANVNDSFILSPTRNAASDLSLQVTDTRSLALAAPIRALPESSNTGSAKISAGIVTDTSTSAFTTTPGALNPPLRIEFLTANSYQILNDNTDAVIEGPLTYDPATSNALFPTPSSFDPGFRVSLSGSAEPGDRFRIDYNAGGYGDNRNALAMTDAQNKQTLDNGLTNMQGGYSNMIAEVGSRTNQALMNTESNQIIVDQNTARLENLVGVNLDEEAAKLLQFEQAYQAAAQMITIATNVFESLISAMR